MGAYPSRAYGGYSVGKQGAYSQVEYRDGPPLCERGDRHRESDTDPDSDNPKVQVFEPLVQACFIGFNVPMKIDHGVERDVEYRLAKEPNENLETMYYQIGWPGSIDLS